MHMLKIIWIDKNYKDVGAKVGLGKNSMIKFYRGVMSEGLTIGVHA